MIILKKTKLKLKKNVWFAIGGIFIVVIIVIVGVNIYRNVQYKQTNEYKLLESGYTEEEINLLEDDFLISLLQDAYFIKDNLNRYTAYHSDNESLSARSVIEIVNTNNDYSYYDHDIDTDISKDYLLLVNKYYHLGNDYVPDDLVNINNKYYYGDGHQMRKAAYDAFIDIIWKGFTLLLILDIEVLKINKRYMIFIKIIMGLLMQIVLLLVQDILNTKLAYQLIFSVQNIQQQKHLKTLLIMNGW